MERKTVKSPLGFEVECEQPTYRTYAKKPGSTIEYHCSVDASRSNAPESWIDKKIREDAEKMKDMSIDEIRAGLGLI